MCVLLCETLQVPNLLRLRAFRGGFLQIRDNKDKKLVIDTILRKADRM
jgi:hypothetical protein